MKYFNIYRRHIVSREGGEVFFLVLWLCFDRHDKIVPDLHVSSTSNSAIQFQLQGRFTHFTSNLATDEKYFVVQANNFHFDTVKGRAYEQQDVWIISVICWSILNFCWEQEKWFSLPIVLVRSTVSNSLNQWCVPSEVLIRECLDLREIFIISEVKSFLVNSEDIRMSESIHPSAFI